MNEHHHNTNQIKLKSLGIDTYRENIIFMRIDCHICRSEGFTALTRLVVHNHNKSIIATLNVVQSDILKKSEAALSEMAMKQLSESEQWVSAVAKEADAPFIVLQKIRRGDADVEVSVPHVEMYKNHTPVLVDDIISTARTMISTIGHLKNAGMQKPVCIGVHGIFADNANNELLNAGTEEIITCNTILHKSNRIKIDELLANEIRIKFL